MLEIDQDYRHLNNDEKNLVQLIQTETAKYNQDNISRTSAYFRYFKVKREMYWAFLASMVSRNAGWNMCDLEGNWLPHLIPAKMRNQLFLTYERANWLIFQDAFPQLLLYHYSTKYKQRMFHLLKFFYVSSFMEREWNYFWQHRDLRRIMVSLIVNEQHVIEGPVLHHPFYNEKIFHSPFYLFQDRFHFSSVLFPTCNGELYGASVTGFKSVNKRIDLGKRLAKILFDENLFPLFYEFALKTAHTGSRYDYEHYFYKYTKRSTPFLRMVYPVIEHHIHERNDWFKKKRVNKVWFKEVSHIHPIVLTDWYNKKQNQIKKMVLVKQIFSKK